MKAVYQISLVTTALLLLAACTPMQQSSNNNGTAMSNTNTASKATTPIYVEDESSNKVETITITARGYGAPPKKYYPEGNRRLMAMRAAKLDAYRSLAERIHGLRIWGGTTVGEMVLEQDEFKVLLDAYIVGAKELSNMPNKDGNYEAIVEIQVDQDFLYKALAHRKDLLTVPAEFTSLKPAELEQGGDDQVSKVDERNPNSQANFYFTD